MSATGNPHLRTVAFLFGESGKQDSPGKKAFLPRIELVFPSIIYKSSANIQPKAQTSIFES